MDAAQRIFNTLSVVPVDRTGGGNKQTTLNFTHFVNGTWITDLVFVNLSTEASRPAPTPFHTAILPSRPAIYFYDTEGNPIAAESVVDITGDLEITEDGALTVQTEMKPLGVLTISTHGRGELVSGSARVVSDGPIGGMLRFEHPDFVGSVRCDAVGEGRFSAVALEMDPATRIFTTLPVFPVPEMPPQE